MKRILLATDSMQKCKIAAPRIADDPRPDATRKAASLSRTITVRVDFEEGRSEMAEASYITRRKDELARIEKVFLPLGVNPRSFHI